MIKGWKRTEDDIEGGIFHIITNETAYVGVMPVIYGYRIVAGFNESRMFFELNYCAGASQIDVTELYNLVYRILSSQVMIEFSVFPDFKVKPIFNDKECIYKLREMAMEYSGNEPYMELPDVTLYRQLQHFYINNKKTEVCENTSK